MNTTRRLPIKRKTTKRGQRKQGPRTADGTRRKDKIKFGRQQWLRRYRDRYTQGEPDL